MGAGVVEGCGGIYLFWNLRVREMMVSVPIATPPLRLPAPIQSAVICGQGCFPYRLMGDIPPARVAQSNAEYPIRSLTVNFAVRIPEDLSATLTIKFRHGFESLQ